MVTREDCVKIGEVSKTHGLQGNVIVTTDNDLLERYADKPVFLQLDGAPVPFFIADGGLAERNHVSYIVKFEYVDSLAEAEHLAGSEVLLEKALLEEEEVNEVDYDVYELMDFEVEDEVSGACGHVAEVADYSGNVVLTVAVSGKEILLPLSEVYIREIDLENRRMRVHIPTELAELN